MQIQVIVWYFIPIHCSQWYFYNSFVSLTPSVDDYVCSIVPNGLLLAFFREWKTKLTIRQICAIFICPYSPQFTL